jgi:hypothetical protein
MTETAMTKWIKKGVLLDLIKSDKQEGALAYFLENRDKLKGVSYESGMFGNIFLRILTIDDKEYIISKQVVEDERHELV